MSHLTRCDVCRKEAETATADLRWLKVQTSGAHFISTDKPEYHLCSWACLLALATNKAESK